MRNYALTAFVSVVVFSAAFAANDDAPASDPNTLIEDFENISGWEKQNGAQLEAADSAKVGTGAVKFTGPGLAFKKVKAVKTLDPARLDDGYEGISFWVKGDGSDQYGSFVLCGQHPLWFPYRYACTFPLKDTEWKKIMIPWDEIIPEDPSYPVGKPGGMPPTGIQHVKLGGKWSLYYNNKPLAKYSFSIDDIRLEPKVPLDKTIPKFRALAEVQNLLKEKKPVNIVCLGDSITAGTSLGKADVERYAQVLEGLLRKEYGYDQITVVSKAVGGAQANDLRIWVNRDLAGTPPDLITVMFGYNDKTWGVPKEYYAYALNDCIDKIGRNTKGASVVMLMPLIPGKGERFMMMDDFAECVRIIANARNLPLCDMAKVFKAFGRDGIAAYLADQAHPNAKGHEVMANEIFNILAGK